VDGREVTCTNITEEERDRTLSIFNVRLHLLRWLRSAHPEALRWTGRRRREGARHQLLAHSSWLPTTSARPVRTYPG
jgi:hypothetical protein